jgi:hypothetical protein
MKLTVKYKLGHSYDEDWEATEFFCPFCGKKRVWSDSGPGDYYMGPLRLCLACGVSFSGPDGGGAANAEDLQRLEALRNGEALEGERPKQPPRKLKGTI